MTILVLVYRGLEEHGYESVHAHSDATVQQLHVYMYPLGHSCNSSGIMNDVTTARVMNHVTSHEIWILN